MEVLRVGLAQRVGNPGLHVERRKIRVVDVDGQHFEAVANRHGEQLAGIAVGMDVRIVFAHVLEVGAAIGRLCTGCLRR